MHELPPGGQCALTATLASQSPIVLPCDLPTSCGPSPQPATLIGANRESLMVLITSQAMGPQSCMNSCTGTLVIYKIEQCSKHQKKKIQKTFHSPGILWHMALYCLKIDFDIKILTLKHWCVFTFLTIDYLLHKSFGILLHRRSTHSLPFIYVFNHVLISLWTHDFISYFRLSTTFTLLLK